MKIIITVSDQVWGGKHRYMQDVADGLVAHGHSVTVLAEEGGAMLEVCQAAGLDTVSVPPFADDTAVDAVSAVLLDRRPHVVCVTGRADASVVQSAGEHTADEMAVCLFRHSAFPLGTTDEVRELFSRVDLVVATSQEQYLRQFQPLVEAGILEEEQVEVLTSGVRGTLLDALDTADRDAARERLGIAPDQYVFLSLARLSWEKGLDRVVGTLPELRSGPDSPPPLLVVAGDGPLEDDLRAQATELGIADQVRFIGHQQEVAPVIAAADAVVLASTVPETGPLALKEAMAGGRPVVAAAQGGIPEFVEDERHGLLIVDDEDLRQAMQQMMDDRHAGAAMGRAGREAIHGGHRAAQRVEYLSHRLDLLVIDRIGPEVVLGEVVWDEVRLREESDSGFVFVPHSSHIMEVDAETFAVLTASVEAKDPRLLLKPAAVPTRSLAERLYAMGALSRPGAAATTPALR
ncbi:glycosyltransferase family 4 protein [Streptomyces clavuligerus]|uniref:Glycosyl transferase group 1 n=1 Tax=Streptomyces clavuligerus TaxID=1901 RepID=E2Q6Q9_STRCL|nr:glycosyltransferase family 4 protein [Streptomyces clavuligerus]ANW18061.1 glycosyl transferase family 1 [Streptomyces clavuligerus]AXU12620.1 glycosyltransferase family 1 protein [Streptomyces clavuligerus]EFG09358.1 Glycosyl transferase group 1 [Streptomyces clavuligerus]MBY6302522.1 glycosyltransferase family 4 protein [Streptomyces clavuligerus]QCS05401.1 glycosyltransferase family 1 protein [Streptomyces clavuligerus]